jgi:hypothetical protein
MIPGLWKNSEKICLINSKSQYDCGSGEIRWFPSCQCGRALIVIMAAVLWMAKDNEGPSSY